jgi:hypothetical protein
LQLGSEGDKEMPKKINESLVKFLEEIKYVSK